MIRSNGISFLFLVSLSILGCGKYEDGPGFSLRSKKARLVNTWNPDQVFNEYGEERTANSNDYTVDIHNDGSYTSYSDSYSESGNWSFVSDMEKVKFVHTETILGTTNTVIEEVTILRLTNTEWWVKFDDGSKIYFKGHD